MKISIHVWIDRQPIGWVQPQATRDDPDAWSAFFATPREAKRGFPSYEEALAYLLEEGKL